MLPQTPAQETYKWGPRTVTSPPPSVTIEITTELLGDGDDQGYALRFKITDPTKPPGEILVAYILASDGRVDSPPMIYNQEEQTAYWQPSVSPGYHNCAITYLPDNESNITTSVHFDRYP